ncbi:GIY-YIG nuclease family protein [Nocardioides sp. NPDC000445]|uniref:GIY-YIG nuclease family protein n=1 Tax=Nocardioides sp. NPDC000445 TaxID=3154257 RepID=UPI0033236F85
MVSTVDSVPGRDAAAHLLNPSRLWTREEALARPSAVPATGGVYAWYFSDLPGVPTAGCVTARGHTLLYVGISPSRPPANGRPASRQTLRTRVRYHYRGNAYGSTLRLTLGALLADQIGLTLRRVGSGTRLTFSDGEALLSDWMSSHARVCWIEDSAPWVLEHALIRDLVLPLNLDQNAHSPFRVELSTARAVQRARAKELPVVPR